MFSSWKNKSVWTSGKQLRTWTSSWRGLFGNGALVLVAEGGGRGAFAHVQQGAGRVGLCDPGHRSLDPEASGVRTAEGQRDWHPSAELQAQSGLTLIHSRCPDTAVCLVWAWEPPGFVNKVLLAHSRFPSLTCGPGLLSHLQDRAE